MDPNDSPDPTPDLQEDSATKPSSLTSAEIGEGFTFPNVETSQAFHWPLSPNRSGRLFHAEAGNKMIPHNNPFLGGRPEIKLYSSTSGESGAESSSLKAGGFTFTESAPLPIPKTPGQGSFGAKAPYWSAHPRSSERIVHAEDDKMAPHKREHGSAITRGLEPEQTIKLLKGAMAILSDEKLREDYEAFQKLKLSEDASNSDRGTQADKSTQTHSDDERPSGKSHNEFTEIKRIASEFLLKILGTQLVGNIFADANQTGRSSNTNLGIASDTNLESISSDTVVTILALAIITTIALKRAES